MKKLLLLSLLALSGVASLRAADLRGPREEYVTRVETCEAILREFMGDPATAIPAAVLQRARAIVIVNQVKAGFVFGVKDGYGVILAKKADGRWSVPVILTAGEASLGLQFGVKTLETIMVITDDATPRLIFNNRFNVGVDARAVAGPHASGREDDNHPIIAAPVLVYTKSSGLYAGATVKAGYLARADTANFSLYHTGYTLPEILYSDWVQPVPEVIPLMDYLKQIAP